MERDLHILPRIAETASFLYIDHAVIERKDNAIALYREEGIVVVPAAAIAVIALGPGTRITHGAMVAQM